MSLYPQPGSGYYTPTASFGVSDPQVEAAPSEQAPGWKRWVRKWWFLSIPIYYFVLWIFER